MFKQGCFLASLMMMAAHSSQGQTLFTYGKHTVSSKEFVRAFEKNPPAGDRKKAMEEYLPLYMAYKLKVRHAYDSRLDTLPGQKAELENYKGQLEESILKEKSASGKLVEEALERSQRDISLKHLYIGFNAGDSNSEKVASQAASKAWEQLKAGKPFAEVVSAFSTDPDEKAAGGKIGWITVFSLPYVYENAVYPLKTGSFTAPIRGSEGFHIFSKTSERPAYGKIKLSQILIWTPASMNTEEKAAKKMLADSLYSALRAGASFESLALQFSNDRTSYATGGQLPEFGVGQFEEPFEEAAFSLRTPGQVSEPVLTRHGYHILKLEKRIPPPKRDGNPETLSALQAEVFNDKRAEIRKEEFLRQQLPKMGYVKLKYPESLVWKFTDSVRLNRMNPAIEGLNPSTALFMLGSKKHTVEDWGIYVAMARAGNRPADNYGQLMNKFVMQKTEEYYRENIGKYEPSFSVQLSEFKDANLLFEAMEKNVWSKAGTDESKLKKYYEDHKTKYTWGKGAQALVVSSADSAAVMSMYEQVKKHPQQWRDAAGKYEGMLMADSSRLELEQLPLPGNMGPTRGLLSLPKISAIDNSYTFVYIFDLVAGGDQRSFDDARGFVMNDYQTLVEKEWLDGLRKKYPVKVNDAEWKKLLGSR